ncbi:hypothetical protein [Marinobacter sp. SS21]|uniref:hypothetical protein n=1 Tax=Marinobacter sp. SS21 TaxID=2979460 RepID=UPI00232D75F1|nr:hypothetical protein [Marinobacter sp. SS21]MDC0664192.1 hypothetical protein [Marinobacter sp. SS21]
MQDLEIYIRDLGPSQLSAWLRQQVDALQLDDSELAEAVLKGQGEYLGQPIRVSVYPQAMGKRYACVVLEGEKLPWSQDLEFARNAWRALDTEVRCSPGQWQEGDPVEDDKWWRIDQRGEQLVAWN